MLRVWRIGPKGPQGSGQCLRSSLGFMHQRRSPPVDSRKGRGRTANAAPTSESSNMFRSRSASAAVDSLLRSRPITLTRLANPASVIESSATVRRVSLWSTSPLLRWPTHCYAASPPGSSRRTEEATDTKSTPATMRPDTRAARNMAKEPIGE
jgi:hypothetical protein